MADSRGGVQAAARVRLMRGIEVVFPAPLEPLPAQIQVMGSAIASMRAGENALLESPTGTGKTLALLCAALAFQHSERAEAVLRFRASYAESRAAAARRSAADRAAAANHARAVARAAAEGQSPPPPPVLEAENEEAPSAVPLLAGPKVFYASRTHSQLAQVAKELRKCTYYTSGVGHAAGLAHGAANAMSTEVALAQQRASAAVQLEGSLVSSKEGGAGGFGADGRGVGSSSGVGVTSAAGAGAPTPSATSIVPPFFTMTVLASRSHSCVHPTVNKRSSTLSALHAQAFANASGFTGGGGGGNAGGGGAKRTRDEPEREDQIARNTIDKAGGGGVDDGCRALLAARRPGRQNLCSFFSGADGLARALRAPGISTFDIEDTALLALGLTDSFVQKRSGGKVAYATAASAPRGCPYFAARMLMADASLVLLPYTYLVDPFIRKSMKIDLEGAIVIIDEAHNIEDACREAASGEWSLAELGEAEREFEKIARLGDSTDPHSTVAFTLRRLVGWLEGSTATLGWTRGISDGSNGLRFESGLADCRDAATSASNARETADARAKLGGASFGTETPAHMWPGNDALVTLQRAGLSKGDLGNVLDALDTIDADMAENRRAGGPGAAVDERSENADGGGKAVANKAMALARRLFSCVELMHKSRAECLRRWKPPQVLSAETSTASASPSAAPTVAAPALSGAGAGSGAWVRAASSVGGVGGARVQPPDAPPFGGDTYGGDFRLVLLPEKDATGGGPRLCLWCMSGAAAFSEVNASARSVLLASGTLAPLDSFAAELGVPFPQKNRVEAKTAVDAEKQVWACVVAASWDPCQLAIVRVPRALPAHAAAAPSAHAPLGRWTDAGAAGGGDFGVRRRGLHSEDWPWHAVPASSIARGVTRLRASDVFALPETLPHTPVPLNGSWKALAGSGDRERYFDGVGMAVLSAALRTPGGLLVFWPSFHVMEAAVARWSSPNCVITLWEPEPSAAALIEDGASENAWSFESQSLPLWEVLQRIKSVFVEPSGSNSSGGTGGAVGGAGGAGSGAGTGGAHGRGSGQRQQSRRPTSAPPVATRAPAETPFTKMGITVTRVASRAGARVFTNVVRAPAPVPFAEAAAEGGAVEGGEHMETFAAVLAGFRAAVVAGAARPGGALGSAKRAANLRAERNVTGARGSGFFPRTDGDAHSTGAIFFAVCRGKASEGIDFADADARSVIVVGVPYPALRAPEVILKRNFCDLRAASERRRGQDGSAATAAFDGNAWYQQQAFRALNQALGRTVRHRFDYGAVLLCDARYNDAEARASTAKWLRPAMRPQDARAVTLPVVISELDTFFCHLGDHDPSRRSAPPAQCQCMCSECMKSCAAIRDAPEVVLPVVRGDSSDSEETERGHRVAAEVAHGGAVAALRAVVPPPPLVVATGDATCAAARAPGPDVIELSDESSTQQQDEELVRRAPLLPLPPPAPHAFDMALSLSGEIIDLVGSLET